jgi:hypothetical protein
MSNGEWGETPPIPSSFNDVGYYKHHIALQHQSYFQQQDGDSIDDVMCLYHSVPSIYEFDNTIFYKAYDTDILDAPKLSQTLTPKTTVKIEPDFQKLRPLLGWIFTDIIQQTSNIQHSTHVFLLLLC